MIKINNILVTITGASGAGKSTIIKELVKRNPEKYLQIPTYTTRTLRLGEKTRRTALFYSKRGIPEIKTKEKNVSMFNS